MSSRANFAYRRSWCHAHHEILGSCVAACMGVRERRSAAMKPFSFARVRRSLDAPQAESYGVHLMEFWSTICCTMARVASVSRPSSSAGRRRCKACATSAPSIASLPNDSALRGHRLWGRQSRGRSGRRIQFWPTSGRARQVALRKNGSFTSPSASVPLRALGGEVELF